MYSTLPPLRLLSVFAAVERHGGLRQAAAALNVSQPAVSQVLRQLEDFLGTRLLDRRPRPARLTAAGRLLHQAAVGGPGRLAVAVAEIRRLDPEDRARRPPPVGSASPLTGQCRAWPTSLAAPPQ